ncbi:hypothetical protein QMA61_00995 [Streptomyces coelicoflavus]|nr:hypothetical protein [Streptomyces coelicoflavus]MDI6514767.1 hypothetical protein [Streptomyces coelicoflavus]
MDILVTVVVLLAVIAAGAFLIRRLNSQHGDRGAAFHYGRGGVVAPGPEDPRRYGTRGRLRPRRRTHGVSAR